MLFDCSLIITIIALSVYGIVLHSIQSITDATLFKWLSDDFLLVLVYVYIIWSGSTH
jgi:hypothetical protein